jgi:LacI family repressor for deo operon, udp, cdd, tsx, nupC, and nupG
MVFFWRMKNPELKKATYQKIASETGISLATISRVITGASPVKTETRRKVLESLEAFGYDTSMVRARENTQSDRLIILNVPSLGNPIDAQIVHGAKSSSSQRGCQLLVNEEYINDNTIVHFLALLRKVQASGLITTNHIEPHLLKRISKEIPLVQCGEYDSKLDIPYVSIDDISAVKIGMEYLFSLGRKNIAFINGPLRYKYAKHRFQGYMESLQRVNIPYDPGLILQLPEISYGLAVSAVTNLFESGKRPDAFFCVSDVFAAAVIKVGMRLGFSIPKDIAVIGFDNVDISCMMSPTITTVSQPQFQLGFSSCELLIECINNPDIPAHNIILATELLVRESTTMKPG